MSARRYPTAELYEDRQRDFYRNGASRSGREYEELDIDISRGRVDGDPRRSAPDFLREDYGRTSAGPMVVRERERERDDFPPPPRSRRGDDEKTEISFRGGRPPPSERPYKEREIERDELVFRRGGREERPAERPVERPRRRERSAEETDITIRRSESRGPPRREVERDEIDIRRNESRGPPRREVERDEIDIRRNESRGPPRREVERDEIDIRREKFERPPPAREIEREDILFRRGEGVRPKPPQSERDEIIFHHEEHARSPSRGERPFEKDSLVIRGRERSLPPPRLVARETEEFVVRRRKEPSPSPSPSPPPRREREEQIIIRRTERSPTPPPAPAPLPPPPEPEPIIRPPIIQEVITHHRHIDHGVERVRSPSPAPPPPPPSPPKEKEDTLEIAIRRRGSRGDFQEDIVYERDSHQRSASAPRRPKPADMWTEVTKDLVLKEAIESYGYDYEETETYFYVMEYLKYEDVLRLVEISDNIRRDRRARIREIQYEREEIEKPPRRPAYDDRFYEREIVYDSRRGGRYR